MLLVAFNKTFEQRYVRVGPAVTVGILRIKYFRRIANDHAFAPRDDASRERQTVQEDRRFVVMTIAFGVFKGKRTMPPGLPFPSSPSG